MIHRVRVRGLRDHVHQVVVVDLFRRIRRLGQKASYLSSVHDVLQRNFFFFCQHGDLG